MALRPCIGWIFNKKPLISKHFGDWFSEAILIWPNLPNWPDHTKLTSCTAVLNVFMVHFHLILESCENVESVAVSRQEWPNIKVSSNQRYSTWFLGGVVETPSKCNLDGQRNQFWSIIEPLMLFFRIKEIKSDWRCYLSNKMLNYKMPFLALMFSNMTQEKQWTSGAVVVVGHREHNSKIE